MHVAGELFKMMAGVDMVHIPYRGDSPAIADLLGGQVQVYFSSLPASIENLKASKLRPLAVTTTSRLDLLPEVPTVSEFLPGFEASAWQGLCGRKKCPQQSSRGLATKSSPALVISIFAGASPNSGSRFSLARPTTLRNSSQRKLRSGPK
jgi:tripartite-type tricarboxylate transporter receptor subunit TctC